MSKNSKQIHVCDFTKREIDFLIENCNFTDTELEFFHLRNKYYTLEQAAEEMNISSKTAYRINKKMKSKIMRALSDKWESAFYV